MGRIEVIIPDRLENYLRYLVRKKGDLSRIVTEALEQHPDIKKTMALYSE